MGATRQKILEIEREGEEIVVRFHPRLLPSMGPEPPGHIRSAGREMLLAVRSLIDAAVQYSEEREKKREHPRTKVEVE